MQTFVRLNESTSINLSFINSIISPIWPLSLPMDIMEMLLLIACLITSSQLRLMNSCNFKILFLYLNWSREKEKRKKEKKTKKRERKRKRKFNGEFIAKLSKSTLKGILHFAENFIFIYLHIYVTGRMLRIHFEYLLLRIVIWAIWKRMKYADKIHLRHLRRYAQ